MYYKALATYLPYTKLLRQFSCVGAICNGIPAKKISFPALIVRMGK